MSVNVINRQIIFLIGQVFSYILLSRFSTRGQVDELENYFVLDSLVKLNISLSLKQIKTLYDVLSFIKCELSGNSKFNSNTLIF